MLRLQIIIKGGYARGQGGGLCHDIAFKPFFNYNYMGIALQNNYRIITFV